MVPTAMTLKTKPHNIPATAGSASFTRCTPERDDGTKSNSISPSAAAHNLYFSPYSFSASQELLKLSDFALPTFAHQTGPGLQPLSAVTGHKRCSASSATTLCGG